MEMTKNKDNSSIWEYINGSSTLVIGNDGFKTFNHTKQIHSAGDKKINKIT